MRREEATPEADSDLPLAPQPCERCVKRELVCRGPGVGRCYLCARLKQACTNATGPAKGKGKRSPAAQRRQSGARRGKASLSTLVTPQVLSVEPSVSGPAQGLKRKVEDQEVGPSVLPLPGPSLPRDEEESGYDSHELPARFNKKRRTAASGAIMASRVLRNIRELEASVRRLEDTYTVEMKRVETILAGLTRDMEAVTGDSEREPSL